jgi:hypothetical protein
MTQAVCNIHSDSRKAVSRRAALTGAAAIAVAVPVTGPAFANSDAELFALGRKLEEALALRDAADQRQNAATKRYHRPAEPALPEPPEEYAALYKKITVGQMEMLAADHPLVVWHNETREEFSRVFGAHLARCHKLQDECGVTAAEDEFSERCQDLYEIGLQILAVRAQTLDGMAIKLRAVDLMSIDFDDGAKDAWDSIAADIQVLAVQS